jgi:hypothetical protein
MMLLLLILLQAERRLSPFVIIGAVLVFIAGVSLLVYFYRRYKRMEKETEDDWDAGRHSLFVKVPSTNAEVESKAESLSPAKVEEKREPTELPAAASGTRELTADIALSSFSPVTAAEAEPQLTTPSVEQPIQSPPAHKPETRVQPPVERKPELRPTEILGSVSIVEPVTGNRPKPEASEQGERVWSDLAPEPLQADVSKPAITPQVVAPPPSIARVESRPHREPFEAPRIDRILEREPYEPPTIEPLKPREPVPTRGLRSVPIPAIERPIPERAKEPVPQGTIRLASTPAATRDTSDSAPIWGETSKVAARPLAGAPSVVAEPSIPAGRLRAHRAGSVLGLPAEGSHQPLILGKPERASDEVGIGALTNYGQDVGPKGGRAGSIALLVVLLVLGVALGLYFFVPSVHSRVGAFVAHLRGTDTQAAIEAAMKPKAQVIPSTRPEVNKNLVTARGAVDNISEEPLENLSVEVSLQRGGGAPPEVRTVSVTPNPLPPGVRGVFEFEYDGKRDTGFLGYTITKLYSNGTEVRFRAPGQK